MFKRKAKNIWSSAVEWPVNSSAKRNQGSLNRRRRQASDLRCEVHDFQNWDRRVAVETKSQAAWMWSWAPSLLPPQDKINRNQTRIVRVSLLMDWSISCRRWFTPPDRCQCDLCSCWNRWIGRVVAGWDAAPESAEVGVCDCSLLFDWRASWSSDISILGVEIVSSEGFIPYNGFAAWKWAERTWIKCCGYWQVCCWSVPLGSARQNWELFLGSWWDHGCVNLQIKTWWLDVELNVVLLRDRVLSGGLLWLVHSEDDLHTRSLILFFCRISIQVLDIFALRDMWGFKQQEAISVRKWLSRIDCAPSLAVDTHQWIDAVSTLCVVFFHPLNAHRVRSL